mmetsp:Transcript_16972/g.42698  ORF Transcript_16972/g.42698 Transcript_16972/m.42698 type:complete len:91 (+) Transcript_16972:97-369(+)
MPGQAFIWELRHSRSCASEATTLFLKPAILESSMSTGNPLSSKAGPCALRFHLGGHLEEKKLRTALVECALTRCAVSAVYQGICPSLMAT